ncbi:magnesium transporter [Virgibacillus sp. MSJ-26]|uniref:magnesium transporter n=1 Tax=Virgibacillus sp. MSJ-26 TaxID=2841522 RepID=UPI001C101759|nr:magnesium transporter [Virgibacillus sp. MSJ-26]MBU5468508.1 magnesium transporter [Virgibacillus sp. MSJ-26]
MQLNLKELHKALKNDDIETFRLKFNDIHPYDQATFFVNQNHDERMTIYSFLSPEEVADLMEHIELENVEPFITEMDPRFASMVLGELPTDDAVDILNEMEKEKVASFLTIMDEEEADEIKALLHYEEKTAGSIMTTEFVAINKSLTVRETMKQLKVEAPDAETIYYLYVIDEEKHLAGVISLRDLIISDEDAIVGERMNENVVSVSVGMDQEDVAQMIMDYDFLAVPVIDFQNHLLGIITVDDILDVVDEEASEDYSKLAAVSDVHRIEDSPFAAAKKRLPWLITLLFLGLFTASLIGQFEDTLEQVAILAIFMPLIAGMAGNTGTQSLAVAVRGLATGEFANRGKLKLMVKETSTGLIIGSVCGITIMVVIYLWKGELFLGFLVGISLLATLTIATLSGAIIPLIMDKFKIDPAVASGPFITTINDLISISIYFGIATAFLSYLL